MWRDPHSEELIVEPVVTAPAPEPPVVNAPVIHDRRRPGRPATVNPHLIPLLRAPHKAEESAREVDLRAPVRRGIGVADMILLLLPFWTVCGVILCLGW